MALELQPEVAAEQWIGKRKRQEDAVAYAIGVDGRHLLVLCDGMGGQVGGDIASQLAATAALQKLLDPYRSIPDVLDAAVEAANNAISDHIAANPDTVGMGTTLIAAILHRSHLWWASVGDSHILMIRNGTIAKLNADHSMRPVLQKLVDEGEISEDQARCDPKRNALRSAIMGGNIPIREIAAKGVEIRSTDIVLISSDGIDPLLDTGKDILRELAYGATELKALTSSIVSQVKLLDRPKQDNISIIVGRFGGQSSKRDNVEDRRPIAIPQGLPKKAMIAIALAFGLVVAWSLSVGWNARENKPISLTIAETTQLLSSCQALDMTQAFASIARGQEGTNLGRAANIGQILSVHNSSLPAPREQTESKLQAMRLDDVVKLGSRWILEAAAKAESAAILVTAHDCVTGRNQIIQLLEGEVLLDPSIAKVPYPLTPLYQSVVTRELSGGDPSVKP